METQDGEHGQVTAPQGWEDCPGSGLMLEQVDGRWSRCPVCRWVGFKVTKPGPTPFHHRPTNLLQRSINR